MHLVYLPPHAATVSDSLHAAAVTGSLQTNCTVIKQRLLFHSAMSCGRQLLRRQGPYSGIRYITDSHAHSQRRGSHIETFLPNPMRVPVTHMISDMSEGQRQSSRWHFSIFDLERIHHGHIFVVSHWLGKEHTTSVRKRETEGFRMMCAAEEETYKTQFISFSFVFVSFVNISLAFLILLFSCYTFYFVKQVGQQSCFKCAI